jgi:OTU domain-containing protein 3
VYVHCSKKEKKPKSRKDTYSGDDLHIQLASLGLRIKSITGDGNCFFRALGDQIEVG